MRKLYLLSAIALSMSSLSTKAYEIYPVPRSLTLSGESIQISSQVNIVKSDATDEVCLNRLHEVLNNAGISWTESSEAAADATDIYIGVADSGDEADIFATSLNADRSIFPAQTGRWDPHLLYIGADDDCGYILLLGDEEGSAFYGCATLEQMFEQSQLPRLAAATVADYAQAKYRGVIEGFYGHPISVESRMNLLDYCKRYKLNFYGYGPKADPYHAGNWRLEYPATVTDEQRVLGQISSADIAMLAAKARECHVDFTWIIHPSLGSYSISLNWVDDIITKFEHMYDLGVRRFGVSVDDMAGQPSNQGQLAEEVQKRIDQEWTDVKPILFTPTAYALNYSGATYVLNTFKTAISEKVEIAFTGYDCFSNVRAASFATIAEYIGRDPVFWWNNPVNDDYDGFLYMHGLTARWTIENQGAIPQMRGFLLNPMNQGQASKVCFFSGADYSWNPVDFDADKSWEAAVRSLVRDEKYVAALHSFINVLSAYTTHDTTTPEGEQFADLYSAFKSAYPSLTFTGADDLHTTMREALEACRTLSELKDSDDENGRLLYTDIQPWLDKVADMANIVCSTMDMLGGTGDLERWPDYANIATDAAQIHTNHTFSVLEGSGTSTYETFKEAQPTPKHLDALIDFLAQRIGNLSLALPDRSTQPEAINNLLSMPEGASIEASYTGSTYQLSGIKGITLNTGEYAGIFLNTLVAANIDDIYALLEGSGLDLQYSVNGKEWKSYSPDEEASFEMAYVRVRNMGTDPVKISIDGFSINAPAAEEQPGGDDESKDLVATVSTNLGTYSTYAIENVLDNNPSTFFWSSAPPSSDGSSYIRIEYNQPVNISSINLVFNTGDQPSGQAELSYSPDGNTWIQLGTFTQSNIVDNQYTLSFKEVQTRYVNLRIASISNANWFQLADFNVNATPIATEPTEPTEPSTPVGNPSSALARAFDQDGNAISYLYDNRLTRGYSADATEGWLTYTLIENLNIDEIQIFHNSTFDASSPLPVVSVLVGDEWIECGTLEGPLTHIDTHSYTNMSMVKIEWNSVNCPDVYEIIAVGTPYVEPADTAAGIDAINGAAPAVVINCTNGVVEARTTEPVKQLVVSDVTGRIIAASTTNTVATAYSGIAIVRLTTVSGNVYTSKILIRR